MNKWLKAALPQALVWGLTEAPAIAMALLGLPDGVRSLAQTPFDIAGAGTALAFERREKREADEPQEAAGHPAAAEGSHPGEEQPAPIDWREAVSERHEATSHDMTSAAMVVGASVVPDLLGLLPGHSFKPPDFPEVEDAPKESRWEMFRRAADAGLSYGVAIPAAVALPMAAGAAPFLGIVGIGAVTRMAAVAINDHLSHEHNLRLGIEEDESWKEKTLIDVVGAGVTSVAWTAANIALGPAAGPAAALVLQTALRPVVETVCEAVGKGASQLAKGLLHRTESTREETEASAEERSATDDLVRDQLELVTTKLTHERAKERQYLDSLAPGSPERRAAEEERAILEKERHQAIQNVSLLLDELHSSGGTDEVAAGELEDSVSAQAARMMLESDARLDSFLNYSGRPWADPRAMPAWTPEQLPSPEERGGQSQLANARAALDDAAAQLAYERRQEGDYLARLEPGCPEYETARQAVEDQGVMRRLASDRIDQLRDRIDSADPDDLTAAESLKHVAQSERTRLWEDSKTRLEELAPLDAQPITAETELAAPRAPEVEETSHGQSESSEAEVAVRDEAEVARLDEAGPALQDGETAEWDGVVPATYATELDTEVTTETELQVAAEAFEGLAYDFEDLPLVEHPSVVEERGAPESGQESGQLPAESEAALDPAEPEQHRVLSDSSAEKIDRATDAPQRPESIESRPADVAEMKLGTQARNPGQQDNDAQQQQSIDRSNGN